MTIQATTDQYLTEKARFYGLRTRPPKKKAKKKGKDARSFRANGTNGR